MPSTMEGPMWRGAETSYLKLSMEPSQKWIPQSQSSLQVKEQPHHQLDYSLMGDHEPDPHPAKLLLKP